jgi:hypothetical protein
MARTKNVVRRSFQVNSNPPQQIYDGASEDDSYDQQPLTQVTYAGVSRGEQLDVNAFGPQPGQSIQLLVNEINRHYFEEKEPPVPPKVEMKAETPKKKEEVSGGEISDLAKILFLFNQISHKLSSHEVDHLKKIAFQHHPLLQSALEAFEIEKNIDEFEETLHRIVALRIE